MFCSECRGPQDLLKKTEPSYSPVYHHLFGVSHMPTGIFNCFILGSKRSVKHEKKKEKNYDLA